MRCGGGGGMEGAGTALARGSAIRALGSARAGGFPAERGSIADDDEAALGSNALARGSATLVGGTGNGTAIGAIGVFFTVKDVCTISNLLMMNSIASGSCG